MLHIFLKKNTDCFNSEPVSLVPKRLCYFKEAMFLQKDKAISLLRLLLASLHGKTSEQMDHTQHG